MSVAPEEGLRQPTRPGTAIVILGIHYAHYQGGLATMMKNQSGGNSPPYSTGRAGAKMKANSTRQAAARSGAGLTSRPERE